MELVYSWQKILGMILFIRRSLFVVGWFVLWKWVDFISVTWMVNSVIWFIYSCVCVCVCVEVDVIYYYFVEFNVVFV